MSFDTQNFPWSLIGKRVNRPMPNGIQEGYTYFADDTDQGFILVIDPYTKVHSWHPFSGLGSVPMDLKFAGGIQLSENSPSSGLIADTVGISSTGSIQNPLGYVFASNRTVRQVVLRVVLDTSAETTVVSLLRNGVSVFGLSIPAGSAPGTTIPSGMVAVAYLGGVDKLDIAMSNPGTGDTSASVEITVTVEYV